MSNIPQVFSDEVAMINMTWCVNPYRPLTGNPIVIFVKRCIRKLTRFLMVPYVETQNDFNAHVTRAFNSIADEMRKQNNSIESILCNMPIECLEIFMDIVNNDGKLSGGIIDANRY